MSRAHDIHSAIAELSDLEEREDITLEVLAAIRDLKKGQVRLADVLAVTRRDVTEIKVNLDRVLTILEKKK